MFRVLYFVFRVCVLYFIFCGLCVSCFVNFVLLSYYFFTHLALSDVPPLKIRERRGGRREVNVLPKEKGLSLKVRLPR